MKKLITYTSILFFSLAVLPACEDEEAVRVPDLIEGASLRAVFPDPLLSFFNFENPETARVQYDLFSQNRNIDSVNIYATYLDASEGVTYPITPEGEEQERQLIRTFRQSDFNSEGALRDITITLSDVANAFGIPLSETSGADVVEFYHEVVLTDGRRFPEEIELPEGYESNTITPDIAGRGVQTSSFNAGFTAYVACPLPAGYATGRYAVEQIAGPDDPFFGNPTRFAPETVTISQTSPIGRRFSATYLTFDGNPFDFNLVCGDIVVPITGTGISCGGPDFGWFSPAVPGQYDIGADDELIIELVDNPGGACGLPSGLPLTLRLTKVE